MLEAVLELTGYRAELEAEHSLEAAGRLENLAELVGVASEHEDLASFLEGVALVNDADQLDDDDSRVALMTLHTAKGLEFPAVFLVGMEEGVFPHLRAMGEPDELEEERRLCYVGMTRAREYLYLSHATCRGLWGSVQWNPPSRFLKEVPEMLLRNAGNGATSNGANGAGRSGTRGRDALVESARRAGRTSPARTTGAERLGLKVGDDVVHGKWGEGVVLELRGSGDKAEATIRFPGIGEKQLLLAWAPLKRA
jgi:DNA helicase-2/ATP-dependent DNA helicase PcrA